MRIALKPGIPGQYDDHVQQNHASHQLWMASDCILIEMKCPRKLTFRNYKKCFVISRHALFMGKVKYVCRPFFLYVTDHLLFILLLSTLSNSTNFYLKRATQNLHFSFSFLHSFFILFLMLILHNFFYLLDKIFLD